MKIVTLPKGRRFYRGGGYRMRGLLWLTTSVEVALSFGDPWVLTLARAVRVARFDGRNAHVELAHFVGVAPDDDDLHPAARAFCKMQEFDGWHLPSFYGPAASDTLLCDASAAVPVSPLSDAAIDAALRR
jgi:hypothetical protein